MKQMMANLSLSSAMSTELDFLHMSKVLLDSLYAFNNQRSIKFCCVNAMTDTKRV